MSEQKVLLGSLFGSGNLGQDSTSESATIGEAPKKDLVITFKSVVLTVDE